MAKKKAKQVRKERTGITSVEGGFLGRMGVHRVPEEKEGTKKEKTWWVVLKEEKRQRRFSLSTSKR